MSRTAPRGSESGELDQPVHRADQLQAAAADVGHDGALAGEREVVGHRPVGEGGLGLGVDDPERDVQLLPHPPDEPGPFSASRTAAVATAAIRRTPAPLADLAHAGEGLAWRGPWRRR